jgi:hypothetical protein
MDVRDFKSVEAMKTFDAFVDEAAVRILAAILGSSDHGAGLFPKQRTPEDCAKLAYDYARALGQLRDERG